LALSGRAALAVSGQVDRDHAVLLRERRRLLGPTGFIASPPVDQHDGLGALARGGVVGRNAIDRRRLPGGAQKLGDEKLHRGHHTTALFHLPRRKSRTATIASRLSAPQIARYTPRGPSPARVERYHAIGSWTIQ